MSETKEAPPIASLQKKRKNVNKIELDASKICPITSVTCFNDRAEVYRYVAVSVQKGDNEITISGVSSSMDKHSIRILDPKGSVTILEVSVNESYTKQIGDDDSIVNQLKQKIEKLEFDESCALDELNLIKKEGEWFNNFAGNHIQNQPSIENFKYSFESDKATKFFDYVNNNLQELDEKIVAQEENLSKIRKELQKFNSELNSHNPNSRSQEKIFEVIVNVNAKAPTDMSMHLAYVVFGASWTASFDARVTTNESDINLSYYGNLRNNTGEDWRDVKLHLSTAQPSVAGKPPDLTTKYVLFKTYNYDYGYYSNYNYDDMDSIQTEKMPAFKSKSMITRNSVFSPASAPAASVLASVGKASLTCTTFTIPRKATAVSDNKPHKVTIRILSLKCEYSYCIIPKLSSHVYLKAKVQNTEKETVLLPGALNVFMDNNFISKSAISLVNPGESFDIFLGVDMGIKFEYQPLSQNVATQGMIMKSQSMNVQYNTIITNNKQVAVKIELEDNLPKSNEGQIKVKLVEPVIVDDNPDITLNSSNNIKWIKKIKPSGRVEVPFKYVIDYPVGKDLENAW